jgi:hypothetical protein
MKKQIEKLIHFYVGTPHILRCPHDTLHALVPRLHQIFGSSCQLMGFHFHFNLTYQSISPLYYPTCHQNLV